jgi:threonine aldolase
MTERVVELRSDTFTRPTAAMRRAMAEAEVGDDVWDEDPTVDRLEARAANLTGTEAALFVTSGTQGNLVGLLAHTRRGDEVILGDRSHIFVNETAGAAVVGGLQLRALPNRDDGRLRPDEVAAAIRDDDDHHPRSGAVALENTHNACGGAVLRPEEIAEVAAIAHAAGVPVHLDGARVFNASVALGVPVADIVAPVDSVTFCLSKGLGAPVGSVLCGSKAFITEARRYRKMLGGGLRQAGVLAAAGLVALEQHVTRLAEDHANARLLAEGLARIPGVAVDPGRVETNIVFFDVAGTGVPAGEIAQRTLPSGVRLAGNGTRFRALTSYEVTRDDVLFALDVIEHAIRQPAAAGA